MPKIVLCRILMLSTFQRTADIRNDLRPKIGFNENLTESRRLFAASLFENGMLFFQTIGTVQALGPVNHKTCHPTRAQIPPLLFAWILRRDVVFLFTHLLEHRPSRADLLLHRANWHPLLLAQ